MTKLRNIPPKSFKEAKSFPGTAGNPFDRILQSSDFFAGIPNLAILLILIVFAWLGGKFVWFQALVLLFFFLGDWLLLTLLPRTQRSFGPVKPVLLMLAFLRTLFALLPFWWGFSAQIIGTFLVIYGFFIEPFRLDIHHEQMATGKFASNDSIKIAHLGDLHFERLTRREKQILHTLEEIKPDLILFSGDVLNLSYVHDPQAQTQARELLSKLHAPLGVFAVTGSPPVDPPEVFANLLSGTNIQWLEDKKALIQTSSAKLSITGLTCSHHPDEDFVRMQEKGLDKLDSRGINILLYHSPDIAPLSCSSGFDLQLSGHTHGGQVRLPFYGAIFAASLYHKTFEAGRYLLGSMTLYVSRGLGMEGGIAPRVRFLCLPELILWEIKGK